MRTAFTLIEILVVISIIAILAGLLLAAMPVIRFNAKALETENRMNGVTHGLAAVASGGKVTQALQELYPVAATDTRSAIGGVIRFGTGSNTKYTYQDPLGSAAGFHRCWPDSRSSGSRPAATASTAANYASGDVPLIMAYPWGRQRLYVTRLDWYQQSQSPVHPIAGWPAITWPALTGLYSSATQMSLGSRMLYEKPEPHCLSHLRPYRSSELLVASGVLPDLLPATRNLAPRARQPWNDAWGNPLVVAYAMYQPPPYEVGSDMATTTNLTNFYFEQAEKTFGFTRSFYVSVAAAGPRLAAPLAVNDAKADAVAIWKQVNEICNRDDANVELWRIDPQTVASPFNAMTTPPWGGVRRTKGKGATSGQRCFLLAPIELQ